MIGGNADFHHFVTCSRFIRPPMPRGAEFTRNAVSLVSLSMDAMFSSTDLLSAFKAGPRNKKFAWNQFLPSLRENGMIEAISSAGDKAEIA
jgi:hypothetical protein